MTRRELKDQAKEALRGNYGSKMLLFLIPILFGIGSGGYSVVERHSQVTNSNTDPRLLGAMAIASIITVLVTILLSIFVGLLEYTGTFCYMKIFRKETDPNDNNGVPRFGELFKLLSNGNGGKIFAVIIVEILILLVIAVPSMIFVVLAPILTWTLNSSLPFLLFIPAIVGYAFFIYLALGWSQGRYLLYDQLKEGNYHGPMGVLSASSQLMKGKRGDYFIFVLSFFWWLVLIAITSGLVGFWTTPYMTMSYIAYYENLKEKEPIGPVQSEQLLEAEAI